jgi:hypothetical protein
MTKSPRKTDPPLTPEMRKIQEIMEGIVARPEFPQYLALLEMACHGPKARRGNCYWCFQIALGSNLQNGHRFLAVPIVDSVAKADKNGDPITEDGKTHPWNAEKDRILCPDCIGSDFEQ